MGKIQSNLFRIDTISSESTTNSTDSELIHKICNVVYRILTVKDVIREYINRTNDYFKTGTWREMDLSAYESEQKQREQLAAKVRELQEKNTELQKAATNYYLYTAEGERLFCERHNCRIYPDNRGIYWHFKVADYPAYTLPTEISRAYLNHEISIRDVYVHWRKNY